MKKMKKSAHQSGQALLIILLVMAVGLTIALSIVSRSVTDIRISREQEESARAFSAAEAGIEEALRVDLGVGDVPISEMIGGVDFTVTAIGQGAGPEFVFGEPIDEGDTQTVWLVGHNSAGDPDSGVDSYTGTQINLYWGNSDTTWPPTNSSCDNSTTPALEAIFIYESGGYKVAKYPLDPDGSRAGACNHFDSSVGTAGYTLGGSSLKFKKTIDLSSLPGTKYVLRLRLLYNDVSHSLGVEAVGDDIPDQGKCYESTATVSESGITRKVRQCQSYPAPPPIFDYVLFSGGSLTK